MSLEGQSYNNYYLTSNRQRKASERGMLFSRAFQQSDADHYSGDCVPRRFNKQMNRVAHHSVIVKINGRSYRTKNLKKKGGDT